MQQNADFFAITSNGRVPKETAYLIAYFMDDATRRSMIFVNNAWCSLIVKNFLIYQDFQSDPFYSGEYLLNRLCEYLGMQEQEGQEEQNGIVRWFKEKFSNDPFYPYPLQTPAGQKNFFSTYKLTFFLPLFHIFGSLPEFIKKTSDLMWAKSLDEEPANALVIQNYLQTQLKYYSNDFSFLLNESNLTRLRSLIDFETRHVKSTINDIDNLFVTRCFKAAKTIESFLATLRIFSAMCFVALNDQPITTEETVGLLTDNDLLTLMSYNFLEQAQEWKEYLIGLVFKQAHMVQNIQESTTVVLLSFLPANLIHQQILNLSAANKLTGSLLLSLVKKHQDLHNLSLLILTIAACPPSQKILADDLDSLVEIIKISKYGPLILKKTLFTSNKLTGALLLTLVQQNIYSPWDFHLHPLVCTVLADDPLSLIEILKISNDEKLQKILLTSNKLTGALLVSAVQQKILPTKAIKKSPLARTILIKDLSSAFEIAKIDYANIGSSCLLKIPEIADQFNPSQLFILNLLRDINEIQYYCDLKDSLCFKYPSLFPKRGEVFRRFLTALSQEEDIVFVQKLLNHFSVEQLVFLLENSSELLQNLQQVVGRLRGIDFKLLESCDTIEKTEILELLWWPRLMDDTKIIAWLELYYTVNDQERQVEQFCILFKNISDHGRMTEILQNRLLNSSLRELFFPHLVAEECQKYLEKASDSPHSLKDEADEYSEEVDALKNEVSEFKEEADEKKDKAAEINTEVYLDTNLDTSSETKNTVLLEERVASHDALPTNFNPKVEWAVPTNSNLGGHATLCRPEAALTTTISQTSSEPLPKINHFTSKPSKPYLSFDQKYILATFLIFSFLAGLLGLLGLLDISFAVEAFKIMASFFAECAPQTVAFAVFLTSILLPTAVVSLIGLKYCFSHEAATISSESDNPPQVREIISELRKNDSSFLSTESNSASNQHHPIIILPPPLKLSAHCKVD